MADPQTAENQRLKWLFWQGCLPVRVLVVLVISSVLVTLTDEKGASRRSAGQSWVAIVLAVPAAGFMWNAVCVRPQVGGLGGVVWWSRVRWAHLAMWAVASATVWLGRKWYETTIVLLLDGLLGALMAYLHYECGCAFL